MFHSLIFFFFSLFSPPFASLQPPFPHFPLIAFPVTSPSYHPTARTKKNVLSRYFLKKRRRREERLCVGFYFVFVLGRMRCWWVGMLKVEMSGDGWEREGGRGELFSFFIIFPYSPPPPSPPLPYLTIKTPKNQNHTKETSKTFRTIDLGLSCAVLNEGLVRGRINFTYR